MRPEDNFESAIRQAGEALGFDPEQMIAIVRAENEAQPSFADLQHIEGELWQLFLDAKPVCSGDKPQIQLIAWGWVAQTFRQAHSAMLLCKDGLPDSAMANARAAFEHGVLLSLLAGAEVAEDVLESLEHQYLNRFRLMMPQQDDGTELFPNLVDSLLTNLTGPRAKGVTQFQDVCAHFEYGELVYQHYRGLSNNIHPGFGSAYPIMMAAFGTGESAVPDLANQPVYFGMEMTLGLAIGGCLWAGWSTDLLFHSDYFGSRIVAMADQLGYTRLDLHRDDPLSRRTPIGPEPG